MPLRRLRVVIFADIINIVTMLIKTIFKDSKKVKRIRNDVYLYLYLYLSISVSISHGFIQAILMSGRQQKKLYLLTEFLNSISKKFYFKAYWY